MTAATSATRPTRNSAGTQSSRAKRQSPKFSSQKEAQMSDWLPRALGRVRPQRGKIQKATPIAS